MVQVEVECDLPTVRVVEKHIWLSALKSRAIDQLRCQKIRGLRSQRHFISTSYIAFPNASDCMDHHVLFECYHTLTEVVSNNQYPEPSAIKKVEHSGFLKPRKKAVKCVESSLYPGRYNPVTRHASPEELLGIHAYFKERPVSPLIKTFHHARTPKVVTEIRPSRVKHKKERGSVVLFNKCVGSISLFFGCSGEDLAFRSWFGYLGTMILVPGVIL
ncbi:unnamed protein product [Mytilus edulis]|uniref:Uncharacterized protein n=1 Tax=Mytilus edulis TaxID=6550 RepID=A0A8S3RCU6_MYTED|nr:unnamed protein product [Mytilus edulis]